MPSLSRSLLFAGFLLAACRGPLPNKDFLWSSEPASLRTANPIDIAVLPPRDMTERTTLLPGLAPASLPLAEIRKLAYRELIDRHYSPLSLDYVDRAFLGRPAPTEASFGDVRERTGADALLGLTINRWDGSRLPTDKLFSIGMEAYLIDARTGQMIWQGKSDWDLLLDAEPDIDRVGTEELSRRAIERAVERLLWQLPKREIG